MTMTALALLAILPVCAAVAQTGSGQLVINGKALDAKEMDLIHRLERQYRVKAVPGRYWYDARSGLYGPEGQAAVGQILPGLPIGGKLREDASRGDTGVWVNGRQLHRRDVAYLQQCTAVLPGRYWVDAKGNGGREGQPVEWNMAQLCAAARRRSGGSFHGAYGSVLSDGTTTGAIFRNSDGSVSGVTCGPDGGCIY